MQRSIAPGTVAIPGLSPFKISMSGFAESSLLQNVISSQTAATIV